jgi:hypothetical protein
LNETSPNLVCPIVKRDELRAIQAPLKQRYENEAGAALVTLAASGALGEGISCSVDTGRALAESPGHVPPAVMTPAESSGEPTGCK